MGEDTKLGSKIKSQITRFAGRLGEGWSKPKRRFLAEMLYGIQAAKDVKVSNIARSLTESIPLIKTENRLCRNLADEDLTGRINRWLAWEGAAHVDDDTVLAIDLSDVRKDYAKKMESLARVRDGSTGEIVDGYWLCDVIAAHPYGDRIVPLYGELYSQKAADFLSENAQLLKAIDTVSAATDKRGIFTIDRGGDRRTLLIPLIDKRLHFIVRQDGNRHVLLPSGKRRAVEDAARWCVGSIARTVEVERDGHREVCPLRLGSLEVRLPERPDVPLWLVVIRGFGQRPILLLTNLAPPRGRPHAVWIADCYLTRWKCEEAHRFVKQGYQLEDVRVRTYVGLRNTYVLVMAVLYFVSVVIGMKAKLNLIFKKVCEKAKRFYEVATFFHYAVADGIYRVLFGSRSGPKPAPAAPDNRQLRFAFATPPT